MSGPTDWTPQIDGVGRGGIARAIVDSLAAGVSSGQLRPGDALPSHRALADRLGINFTTVTRAYEEARRSGLIDSQRGRGTFVAAVDGIDHRPSTSEEPRSFDLAANSPPPVPSHDRLGQLYASVELRDSVQQLLRRRAGTTDMRDVRAGARWLADVRFAINPPETDRVVLASGVRSALTTIFGIHLEPGDVVLTEALAWPALRAIASATGVRLEGVAIDEGGCRPEALAAACERLRPKAVCLTPVMHNPTGATLDADRLDAIVEIARRHGLIVIEDDVHGPFTRPGAPPSLAELAPERTYSIGGLAKCLVSGLRVAYVLCPDVRAAQRLASSCGALGTSAPPLEAALATRLVESGAAAVIRAEVGAEMRARFALALAALGPFLHRTPPPALHLWLPLPAECSRATAMAELYGRGVAVVPSDAFALGPAPEAIRLSLGGPSTRVDLNRALEIVADVLEARGFAGEGTLV